MTDHGSMAGVYFRRAVDQRKGWGRDVREGGFRPACHIINRELEIQLGKQRLKTEEEYECHEQES